METNVVATIDGRHYVYARDIGQKYFGVPWSAQFEIRSGMVRGRWHRIRGGRERILLDLEDAKIIRDMSRALAHVGIKDKNKRREIVMDYFAIRAGFESWGQAWETRGDLRRSDDE